MKAVLVALAALAAPALGLAQRVQLSGRLAGTALRVRTALPGSVEALSGSAFGGEGVLQWRRFSLTLAYDQGSVDPDSAGPVARDYVSGAILVGARVTPWFALRLGPHARAYVTNAGTQRWLFWELRGRFDAPVVAGWIRGHVEVWSALSGNVNVAEAFGSARGGTAGVTTRLGGSPLWARLQYGIDEARLASGARRETVEGLTLALGIGRE